MLPIWLKFKKQLAKLLMQERGSVAIITGLLLIVCIGFAGLAIDVGTWYNQKRQLQLAADAGAGGGVVALSQTGVSTVNAYVTHDVTLNGCTAANNCTIVAINSPPQSGANSGNTNAVEVILSKPASLYLTGIFLASSPTITARAVAINAPASNCLLLMGSGLLSLLTAPLTLTSTAHVQANLCNLYINALGLFAISASGGATVDVNKLTVGGPAGLLSGAASIVSNLGITLGAPAASDPYAGFQIPVFAAATTSVTTSGNLTINPGSYTSITANNGANLTLNPGVYFVDSGNFLVNSGATVVGNGVTIISTSSHGVFGTVTVNNGSNVTLTAPSAGPTAGFVFIGDRASANLTANLKGGANQNLSGILYFPTQALNFTGSTAFSANVCLQIIAKIATLTGYVSLGSCGSGSGGIQLTE